MTVRETELTMITCQLRGCRGRDHRMRVRARTDQIENEVEDCIFQSVRDEDRFEPETFPCTVNSILDNLPEESEADNAGDDS